MSLKQKLQGLIEKSEIKPTTEQVDKLIALVELLNKWNKAYNLTSVRNPEDMLVRHIMDSIVLVKHLPQQSRLIDVGTGPGLPGLPLAIMMPDTEFTLLDSLGKRLRFIRQVCFDLGINNVKPVQSRVEEYNPEILYDGVLSRAFASLNDMLSWCQHLTPDQGSYFAMKGLYPEDELAAMPAGFSLQESNQLSVPELNEDRFLLHIVKSH